MREIFNNDPRQILIHAKKTYSWAQLATLLDAPKTTIRQIHDGVYLGDKNKLDLTIIAKLSRIPCPYQSKHIHVETCEFIQSRKLCVKFSCQQRG